MIFFLMSSSLSANTSKDRAYNESRQMNVRPNEQYFLNDPPPHECGLFKWYDNRLHNSNTRWIVHSVCALPERRVDS